MDILQTLRDLNEADRAWIIARLPAHAKSRLLSASADDTAPKQAADPGAASAAQESALPERSALESLARADAKSIASLLKSEPPWLAAALIAARKWPWADELLDVLPATMRSGIVTIHRAGCTFTPALVETLARLIAARLERSSTPRSPSRFEALLDRLSAARSKRRMSIHL